MRVAIIMICLFVYSGLTGQNFTLITTGDIANDTTNTNGASFVDYDSDGDLDIFLSNANAPFGFNSLYKNEGNDQFTKVDAGEVTNMQTITFGHCWVDFDNDGLKDLFVVNAFTNIGSLLYKNLGNDKFRRVENYNTGKNTVLGFAATWGDFDNDGLVDLMVAHPAGGFVGLPTTSNFLFRNNGDQFGSFTSMLTFPITRTTAAFTNATWSDYDQDGDADLFIGSGPANGTKSPDYHYKNLLKETGKTGFQRITDEIFAQDSLDGQTWNWIDYDNDGDLDAYLTNWGGSLGGIKNNLYRNEGDTIVRIEEGAIVNDIGISLANVWADFDNDGDLDVYVGNGSNQANRYYENQGNGNFKSITKGHFVEEKKNTWGVSAGDYNNDGKVDLFVSNKTRYVAGGDINYLYRNDENNGFNWLIIECIGEQSNKSGIGTKVKLTSQIDGKSVTQYREIGSNATFLGNNDIRAHFGLKTSKRIEKVEIIWPSGQIDVYQDVKPNQILKAVEGKSLK
ncbi:CRTAC1 family protein [Fulvivirgaceae bacterium BMA10]|uniref:CRTAC1 family protein n=1 Tax=Splendidivirga corallicola TaxID=3051826 RepID=A0ABT8KK61_9BACT|nr:CRTAC1 family protein [Fulvivirgaceae bacterium BMA10]